MRARRSPWEHIADCDLGQRGRLPGRRMAAIDYFAPSFRIAAALSPETLDVLDGIGSGTAAG